MGQFARLLLDFWFNIDPIILQEIKERKKEKAWVFKFFVFCLFKYGQNTSLVNVFFIDLSSNIIEKSSQINQIW